MHELPGHNAPISVEDRKATGAFFWATLFLATMSLFTAGLMLHWTLDIMAIVAAVAAIFLGLTIRTVRPSSSPPPLNLLAATEVLKEEISRRWTRESQARGLDHDDLIDVQWCCDDRLANAAVHLRENGRSSEFTVKDMVDLFLAMQPPRLVLVGDAGSGKSALALLILKDLLARGISNPESPIPAVLSLGSWNPDEGLGKWIRDRLCAEYQPTLQSNLDRRTWQSSVELLLSNHRIMPIFDGLDELDEARRAGALDAINDWGSSEGLILTCRGTEYDELVRAHGSLRHAAISRAQPVTADALNAYLASRDFSRPARWETIRTVVRDALREAQDPSLSPLPLVKVLASPFAVSLLAEVYKDPDTDPSRLVDRLAFPNESSIWRALLSGFMKTYRTRMHLSIDGTHWRPESAERWAMTIARFLESDMTTEFSLWQLSKTIGKTQRIALGLVAALIGGVVASSELSLLAGLAAGAVAGGVLGTLSSFLRRDRGRPRTRVPVGTGRKGSTIIRGNGPLHIVAFGGLSGVVLTVLTNYVFRALHLYGGDYVGTALGAVMAVLISIPDWQPSFKYEVVPQNRNLRIDDRVASLGFLLVVFGLLIGLVFALGRFWGAFTTALLPGYFTSYVLDLLSMGWISMYISRCVFIATGSLPWRIVSFLDDSYAIGLFRRSGNAYQFRHRQLQDYLAHAGLAAALPIGDESRSLS